MSFKQDVDRMPMGMKFRMIHMWMKDLINQRFSEENLTGGQIGILFYLYGHADHPVNQKELCEAIRVTHPTMIGFLDRLEEKGMIERQVNPENKKSRIVQMTDKAKTVVRDHCNYHEELQANLVEGMSKAEAEELDRLLAIACKNLERKKEGRND